MSIRFGEWKVLFDQVLNLHTMTVFGHQNGKFGSYLRRVLFYFVQMVLLCICRKKKVVNNGRKITNYSKCVANTTFAQFCSNLRKSKDWYCTGFAIRSNEVNAIFAQHLHLSAKIMGSHGFEGDLQVVQMCRQICFFELYLNIIQMIAQICCFVQLLL